METVRLGSGGGTKKHEASTGIRLDHESKKIYSSRLRAFPMASSTTGTQEIVDGNLLIEIYKRMVASRDPSVASYHL